MVAANRCAAKLLADNPSTGPFVVHDGFRRDRLKERGEFLTQYLEGITSEEADTLAGYRKILNQLKVTEHELPLRSLLNRLLTRARLSKRPGPHMGMCLEAYTNCTSPLRKYLDFIVHLQIKAILRGEEAAACDQPELDALSKRLSQLREVSLEAERWLTHEYLQRLAKASDEPWAGRIVHLGNHGFTVRLDANGLEGFVDLRAEKEKFRTDPATATVSSKKRRFRVNDAVLVTLAGEDEATPHLSLLRLASEVSAARDAGEGNGVADVIHAGDVVDEALETKAES
jgi:ribonuclease R